MRDEILRQLSERLDENTIAFFSVTLTKQEDESILPTIHEFGHENLTYERRVYLSDALIQLAQQIRQHR
jgi:hypothetical protein